MDAPHLPHGDNPWAAPPPAAPQHLVPPQPTAHHTAWPQQAAYAYPVANPAYGVPAPPWWTQHPGYWQRPPRSQGKRVAIFAGMVAGYLAGAFALLVAFVGAAMAGVNPNDYATEAAYDAAVDVRFEETFGPLAAAWIGLLLVGQLVTLAVLAPKVRYRWFDTFQQLIPVYGWYFVGKILWRCTDIGQWKSPPAGPWGPPQPYAYAPHA